MAWLVGDGFDFYGGSDFPNPAIWQAASFVSLYGASRFPAGPSGQTGQSLMLGNQSLTAGNISTIQFTNSQTIFVNYNILTSQAHVNGGTTQINGFTLRDTNANIQCGVYLRNGGDFVLTTGAVGTTVLATSPVLMPLAGQWAHIQVKIFVHNTAGTIEMRINGSTTANWTASGLNTRNGSANFYANVVNLQSTSSSNDVADDFYVFNDQGAQPNTFQGDVHAIRQVPFTDVAITWTRNTGTNNCLAVDDLTDDSDSTYVSTAVVNNVDTYALTMLSPTPNSIIAVCPRYSARMDDAGPHTLNAQLTSGGTTVNLPTMTTTNTYALASAVYVTDPNTGLAWTPTNLANALLSIKLLT